MSVTQQINQVFRADKGSEDRKAGVSMVFENLWTSLAVRARKRRWRRVHDSTAQVMSTLCRRLIEHKITRVFASREDFLRFVCRKLRDIRIDAKRRHSRIPPSASLEKSNTPTIQVDQQTQLEIGALKNAECLLASDNPYFFQLVDLYYYRGMSTREVASELDRPEATVRRHLASARARLKLFLEKQL